MLLVVLNGSVFVFICTPDSEFGKSLKAILEPHSHHLHLRHPSIILFDFLLYIIYLDTLCLIYEIILLIITYPYSNILHTKASEFTDPP